MRVDDVLGVICFGNRVSGEQVGCCFWSTSPGGLGEELAVLGFEDGSESGETVVRDGLEERVVVCGHCFEGTRFRSLNGVDDDSSV